MLGHSNAALLARTATDHPQLAGLRDAAAELDLFYIPARYPKGLIDGVPHEVFTASQATRALDAADSILSAANLILSDW